MMDMVDGLYTKALIERFEYIELSRPEVMEWITKEWKPLINQVSRSLCLSMVGYTFTSYKKRVRRSLNLVIGWWGLVLVGTPTIPLNFL